MFFLNKQERIFLFCVCFGLLCGITADILLKEHPALRDIVNLVDGDRLINKLDINTATKQELIDLPYIGNYTAEAILRYREDKGAFTNLEELKGIKGIREKNFTKFVDFLEIKDGEKVP
ncbi:MAG: helix-hairpin-helix domain-containing protein [Candidatus Omnitrophica bacterium]|nr:helix-hairpin-helix domain-containing protein [Candidatus Omnitrophota bacterium]